MWYKRKISDNLQLAARKFPVLVLSGARQAGKTELLRRLFPDHTYLSLDIPSAATFAEDEPRAFLEKHPGPLLIDEVQYAPGLFRHLKAAVDSDRHRAGRFVLTGSQKFSLMKEVSESLAGRAAILDLETLALGEICEHQPPPMTAQSYAGKIVRGGFPELWRDQDIPLEMYFGSYVATYLERDVRQILNVTSLRDFERFVRACAARSGQLLNKSALANDVGISSKAVTSWLSVLQASNQIALIEPWFANFGKRIVKSPKLYFCDSGLLCYLLGVTEENLLKSPFLGAIWEGYVFSELRKLLDFSAKPLHLWFYRDKQQVEIDFLVLGGGFGRLIECKWTELPDRADIGNIQKIRRIVTHKRLPDFARTKAFVVARPEYSYRIDEETRAIPILELAEQLELE